MGVFGNRYPVWIHMVPKGYVNFMAYVNCPTQWYFCLLSMNHIKHLSHFKSATMVIEF